MGGGMKMPFGVLEMVCILIGEAVIGVYVNVNV